MSNLLAHALPNAIDRGEGGALTWGEYAWALLYNGLGEYEAAMSAALSACEHDELGLVAWAMIELVEAAARSDRPDIAAATLGRLTERTQASGTDWALGIGKRSRPCSVTGTRPMPCTRRPWSGSALRVRVHLARAHLVYGEWLLRAAALGHREHLRVAHDMFSAPGGGIRRAGPPGAVGDRRDRAQAHRRAQDVLTPQEAQVAQLAAEATPTPRSAPSCHQPGAAEYHLSKVFTKLAISSRRQLRGALDQLERSSA